MNAGLTKLSFRARFRVLELPKSLKSLASRKNLNTRFSAEKRLETNTHVKGRVAMRSRKNQPLR